MVYRLVRAPAQRGAWPIVAVLAGAASSFSKPRTCLSVLQIDGCGQRCLQAGSIPATPLRAAGRTDRAASLRLDLHADDSAELLPIKPPRARLFWLHVWIVLGIFPPVEHSVVAYYPD